MTRWWKFRRWMHIHVQAGHEPDWYTWTGVSGAVYTGCHTCDEESKAKTIEYEEKKRRKMGLR